MPRWSVRRGQVEPLAALAAVFVLGVALGSYTLAYDAAIPGAPQRDPARPALKRVLTVLRPDGVVRPARLDRARDPIPDVFRANVSVRVGNTTWAVGPRPPTDADAATRTVPVRVAPGTVRPGHVEVQVWR